jgi:hypothetical protein
MKENKVSSKVAYTVIAIAVIIAGAAIWAFTGARRIAGPSSAESEQHVPKGKPMGAGIRSSRPPSGPPRMGPPGGAPGGMPRMGPPGGMGGSGMPGR